MIREKLESIAKTMPLYGIRVHGKILGNNKKLTPLHKKYDHLRNMKRAYLDGGIPGIWNYAKDFTPDEHMKEMKETIYNYLK